MLALLTSASFPMYKSGSLYRRGGIRRESVLVAVHVLEDVGFLGLVLVPVAFRPAMLGVALALVLVGAHLLIVTPVELVLAVLLLAVASVGTMASAAHHDAGVALELVMVVVHLLTLDAVLVLVAVHLVALVTAPGPGSSRMPEITSSGESSAASWVAGGVGVLLALAALGVRKR
jgi:hypothetical protein